MQVSEATLCFVASQDLTLNKRDGWRANDMARNLHRLMEFGAVEVGWRESAFFCARKLPKERRVAPSLRRDRSLLL